MPPASVSYPLSPLSCLLGRPPTAGHWLSSFPHKHLASVVDGGMGNRTWHCFCHLNGWVYGFTGREYETNTGLYYYRARYYNPAIGRFLQPDPIGYYDSLNLYQYCGNNPVNWIDPWGLLPTMRPDDGPATPGGSSTGIPAREYPSTNNNHPSENKTHAGLPLPPHKPPMPSQYPQPWKYTPPKYVPGPTNQPIPTPKPKVPWWMLILEMIDSMKNCPAIPLFMPTIILDNMAPQPYTGESQGPIAYMSGYDPYCMSPCISRSSEFSPTMESQPC